MTFSKPTWVKLGNATFLKRHFSPNKKRMEMIGIQLPPNRSICGTSSIY